MAQAEIGYLEAAQGDLPDICLCCGKPATVRKEKTLSTLPFGMPFLLIPGAIIWGGKIAIQAPLCTRHKNYFLNRLLLRAFGWFPILFFLAAIGKGPDQKINVAGWGAVLSALAYGILILMLHYRGLRVVKHNRERMVVAGLSPQFADALEEKHRAQRELLEGLSQGDHTNMQPISDVTSIKPADAIATPSPAPGILTTQREPSTEFQGIRRFPGS
jgi:hypothetical protein